MAATPADVQAKIDRAIAELKQTTVGYVSSGKCRHTWTTPPVGSHWANALSLLSAAHEEAGQLLPPQPAATKVTITGTPQVGKTVAAVTS